MSISMNNHESRIVALEGKIGAGGGIIESKLSLPGYCKFANGLLINFGRASNSGNNFAKPFTSTVFGYAAATINGSEGAFSLNEGRVHCNLTRIYTTSNRHPLVSYIAIGILYTNRIIAMLREVF